jgi:hypothetical protein
MIGFERDGRAEQFLREPLKQDAGEQAIEVAFVSDDYFGLGQIRHGGQMLNEMKGQRERGIHPAIRLLKFVA